MIKTYVTLCLVLSTNFIFSQNEQCDCLKELDDVAAIIKNAKSYQIQIKKANKEADLEAWQEKIKKEIAEDSISKYFCSGYLQKYISFIKDTHNQIYLEQPKIISDVPTYLKPIDTIENSSDSISGIYYMGSDKILLKQQTHNIWYGIMLKSETEEWTKGKIRLRLKKNSNDEFELFEYYPNGMLFYQNNIKITDGRIHNTFWNKANKYYFNKNQEENFTYESLDPSFDYIGIKTLKRTKALMKEANEFYAKTLDKLTKENLIIDLRNNGSGATLQAKALVKSLQKNKAIKIIYVIINFKTGSAAELIALELKQDKRTILVGESSAGMLEYGYGNKAFSTHTNCSKFKILLSTEHTQKKLEKYEEVGLIPDYVLNNKSDWIEQVISIAKSRK